MITYCIGLGQKDILCKLDSKKVFDSINWDSYLTCLKAMAFPKGGKVNWLDKESSLFDFYGSYH